jgi:hypothetical protein
MVKCNMPLNFVVKSSYHLRSKKEVVGDFWVLEGGLALDQDYLVSIGRKYNISKENS